MSGKACVDLHGRVSLSGACQSVSTQSRSFIQLFIAQVFFPEGQVYIQS